MIQQPKDRVNMGRCKVFDDIIRRVKIIGYQSVQMSLSTRSERSVSACPKEMGLTHPSSISVDTINHRKILCNAVNDRPQRSPAAAQIRRDLEHDACCKTREEKKESPTR
jgi:hypothetical protein